MTRNELDNRVDQINQQRSVNTQPANTASGTDTSGFNDNQAQNMNEMLANIFIRGGY